MQFPSKKQFEKNHPKFALIPDDDYSLKITKIEETKQKKYQSQDDEDVFNITLVVVCLKDGTEAIDEEGKPAEGRRVFFTARPDSMGFSQDGMPSKTRSLVAYATDQDVYEEIELEAWEQLLGKQVNTHVIIKPNQKGERKNVIGRFLAPRMRKPKIDDDIPVIEEEEIP